MKFNMTANNSPLTIPLRKEKNRKEENRIERLL